MRSPGQRRSPGTLRDARDGGFLAEGTSTVGVVAERTCSQWCRLFQPSSRHLRCPAFRSRDACACGRPKQTASATCTGCRPTGGTANARWRGGRVRHKAGYVLALAREHPRAGSDGYVFERNREIVARYEPCGRPPCGDRLRPPQG